MLGELGSCVKGAGVLCWAAVLGELGRGAYSLILDCKLHICNTQNKCDTLLYTCVYIKLAVHFWQ